MEKIALFVRHKSKLGQRENVRDVWERYVKPRAQSNPNHEAYYFCYDESDEDVISVFQLFSNKQAVDSFMKGEWYAEYLKEVSEYILEAPQLITAVPQWIK